MPHCFAVADLHGSAARYEALFSAIVAERPAAVFLGGDLLPFGGGGAAGPQLGAFPFDRLEELKRSLGADYPHVFVILGNDDPRAEEPAFLEADRRGILTYLHDRREAWDGRDVFGYAFIPPTPFRLKDWERYDVSRYVDPGCVSPEAGVLTVARPDDETKHATIQSDLERLTDGANMTDAIVLFHSPPYQTKLDRAALDGKTVDHAPVDCHVGSIAIRRFIEARQPLLTLHGHIHESARLTGDWCQQIGRTWCFSAAHDGPELALVKFDPKNLRAAVRHLI